MVSKQPERTDAEIVKIRDEAVRRALSTPPKPYRDSKAEKGKQGSGKIQPRNK